MRRRTIELADCNSTIEALQAPPGRWQRRNRTTIGDLEMIQKQGAALESGAGDLPEELERRLGLRIGAERIELVGRVEHGRAVPRTRVDEHCPASVLECPPRDGLGIVRA